jgi:zinc-ribbon domain
MGLFKGNKVPCVICGANIAKFYGKKPMGICEPCKMVYCPKCTKALKKGKCTACGNKVLKTKSIMKKFPEGWEKGAKSSKNSTGNIQNSNNGIFCGHCGKENPSNNNYCKSCGDKL